MTEPSGRSILRARVCQFVRAPTERVYAAYIDPALMPQWMGIQAITEVSGPLDRPGTTLVEVVFGPYRPRSEVLAAERPRLHAMGGPSAFGTAWRWTARFAAHDSGTEITVEEEVSFGISLIGRMLRRSQEGGRMERGLRRRLVHFAELVEAGGA